MKNIGVWMDRRKAHLVIVEKAGEKLETVNSGIESYRPVGGSRSKNRWGPQDVVQDSKYTERRKHQMKRYFKTLVKKIGDAETIVIYGPGTMSLKFTRYMEKYHKFIRGKIRYIKKADSMTVNQVKALIRDFFVNPGRNGTNGSRLK